MEVTEIKYFVEAALLAAARPLSIDHIQGLFDDKSKPEKAEIREAIAALEEDYSGRGIEIAEVASGFRLQIRQGMADRLERLWEERPPRYSRALFETLALIAYRQPITRGEIEEVRGVSVSPNIIRSLLEREWVRVVGHRDVPGRPAMFGTTRQFLDYFGLKKLDDLPPLADLADWESLRVQLDLPEVQEEDVEPPVPEEASEGAVVTPLRPAPEEPAAAESGDSDASGESETVASDAPIAAEAGEDEERFSPAGDEAESESDPRRSDGSA